MSSQETAAHVAAMLAAGVVAAGLVLGTWALAPKFQPEPAIAPVDAQTVVDPVGRWEFVDSSNDQAFVEFTEFGSWFGSDGCNSTGAAWSVDDDTLVMYNDLGQNGLGCNNMSLPGLRLEGTITGSGELSLTGETGSIVTLVSAGRSAASLIGGTWEVPVDYDATAGGGTNNDGTQPPTTASITFAVDGTWTGTNGCNDLSGTWTWDRLDASEIVPGFGAILSIGEEIASRAKACEYSSTFPMVLTSSH